MKKRSKFLIFPLVLALCATLLPAPARAAETKTEAAGDLTRMEIATAAEWMAFAQSCRLDAWSRDKEIVLTADIDLGGLDYQPIPSFGGRFDGGGHRVSGLSISSSAAPSGLFGETEESAEIVDLCVSGVLAPSGDGSTVGGIVGRNRGLLQNCRFDGSVTGKSRCGGLVGWNAPGGVVDGCSMSGQVSGKSMTGGIAGRNDGTILHCRNDGRINVEGVDPSLDTDSLSLSGLLSAAEDDSLAVVNVATDTGGICGYSAGTIQSCRNAGSVGYPHIGYNTGGVVGRNLGYLFECVNSAPVSGRRDIGGVAGQMEPYVELVLTEDTAQKLQQQMNSLSYLLNVAVKDARGSSDDAAARLEQIAGNFRPLAEAALSSDDPAQIAQQLGALTGSMAGLSGQLNAVADGMRQSGEALAGDMQQVIYQLNAVNATLSQAISAAGSVGSTDVLSDTSQENVDAVSVGKAKACRNTGDVEGDLNVGGVTGSMSIEVEMDPEGDTPGSLSSTLHREYQLKSILQDCVNQGRVLARKDCAGSVCGRMELGLIYGCWGFGSVESESGDYVGGIVGLTQGVVRSCWAKCFLRGGRCVGGIAGSGARNETTGDASMIAECRSMVSIPRSAQYAAAIAGGEDGDFSDNLFVSESLAGINRIDRAGQAEPISYQELLSLDGLPSAFRILTLSFWVDGEPVASRAFRYGESFGEDIYPPLPEREGFYGVWDREDLGELRFDTVVSASYLPVVSALRSQEERGQGRPVFFAEGAFREGDALGAERLDTEDLAAIAGPQESVLRSALRGDISRNLAVSEEWALTIPADGAESHTLRYDPPEGADGHTRVYLKTGWGWEELECSRFGHYLTFTVDGSEAQIAAVTTEDVWWVVALYAGAALLCLAALALGLRRIKKSRG